MTTVNILEKWKCGILVNAPNYSVQDASQAFRDAWNQGIRSLFLPEVPQETLGHKGTLPGYYPVADLDPPDGCMISCESDRTEVRGVYDTDAIIHTTQEKRRIRITGGTWTQADCVWRHAADQTGDRSNVLIQTRLEQMRITDVVTAFDFSGAFRTIWRDLDIQDVCTGIKLDVAASAYLNDNHVDGCEFQNCSEVSISLEGPGRKYLFTISRCLFQNHKDPTGRAAILVSDDARSITIEGCFFERIGREDILFEAINRPVRSNLVRGCRFSTPTAGQSWRIRNQGRASYVAEDNMVRVGDNQVFARCEGVRIGQGVAAVDFKVWLVRNCIHNLGASSASYEARLFAQPPGSQTVESVRNEASQNVTFP